MNDRCFKKSFGLNIFRTSKCLTFSNNDLFEFLLFNCDLIIAAL